MIKRLLTLSLIELTISGATLKELRSKYQGSEAKSSHWLLSESNSFSILRVTSDLIGLQPALDKRSQQIFGRFWFEQFNGKPGRFYFAMIREPYQYSALDDKLDLLIEGSKTPIRLKHEWNSGVWSAEVPVGEVVRISKENTGLILAGGAVQISVKIPKETMQTFLEKVPK